MEGRVWRAGRGYLSIYAWQATPPNLMIALDNKPEKEIREMEKEISTRLSQGMGSRADALFFKDIRDALKLIESVKLTAPRYWPHDV